MKVVEREGKYVVMLTEKEAKALCWLDVDKVWANSVKTNLRKLLIQLIPRR